MMGFLYQLEHASRFLLEQSRMNLLISHLLLHSMALDLLMLDPTEVARRIIDFSGLRRPLQQQTLCT